MSLPNVTFKLHNLWHPLACKRDERDKWPWNNTGGMTTMVPFSQTEQKKWRTHGGGEGAFHPVKNVYMGAGVWPIRMWRRRKARFVIFSRLQNVDNTSRVRFLFVNYLHTYTRGIGSQYTIKSSNLSAASPSLVFSHEAGCEIHITFWPNATRHLSQMVTRTFEKRVHATLYGAIEGG